jgi:aminotransferase
VAIRPGFGHPALLRHHQHDGGRDLAGVGEPDFVTPLHIRQAGIRSLQEGRTAYTSNFGTIELRRAIARQLEQQYGVTYDPPGEVIVTAGVSEALDLAVRATIDPGDEVIIPSRRTSRTLPASSSPGACGDGGDDRRPGFRHHGEAVAAAITPRTKAILLAIRTIPTGTAVARPELAAIVRSGSGARPADLLGRDLRPIGVRRLGAHLRRRLPGARERTILLNGCSKSYAMTGWRVGPTRPLRERSWRR